MIDPSPEPEKMQMPLRAEENKLPVDTSSPPQTPTGVLSALAPEKIAWMLDVLARKMYGGATTIVKFDRDTAAILDQFTYDDVVTAAEYFRHQAEDRESEAALFETLKPSLPQG
jgi:hypothetical protein